MHVSTSNNPPLLDGLQRASDQPAPSSSSCSKIVLTGLLVTAAIAGSVALATNLPHSSGNAPQPLIQTSTPHPSFRPTVAPTPNVRSKAPSFRPTLSPTTSGSSAQVYVENDTPNYLCLIQDSVWGQEEISCVDSSGNSEDCTDVLEPGERQYTAMIQGAPPYSASGMTYNMYSQADCVANYISTIGIDYSLQNGNVVADLENTGDGSTQLKQEGSDYSLQLVAAGPTAAPTNKAPSTTGAPSRSNAPISFRPTNAPTTRAPTTTQAPSRSNAPTTKTPTLSPTRSSAPYSMPPTGETEQSAWGLDWTAWPPYPAPAGINVYNVFVGELTYNATGYAIVDGFGDMNAQQVNTLAVANKALGITTKVSIGGGGGSYDNTWNLLTQANVAQFGAQNAAYIKNVLGAAGEDVDFEPTNPTDSASIAQQKLVGQYIAAMKKFDPNFQISLCTNAGFGPNYPWQGVVQNVFNNAIITPGKCPVDRLYIMSYYNSMTDEQGWITGWANWILTNYNCPASVVTVGIDTFDADAYDPVAFSEWAVAQGYSIAWWAYDPAYPENAPWYGQIAPSVSKAVGYVANLARRLLA